MEGDPITIPSTNLQRTSSPSEDGGHPRSIDVVESKPHPTLWFDDGSLVMRASSVQYRVHRTILCQHSAIFGAMVAMPQPDGPLNSEDTFDGCPLVRMTNSPDDLTMLLEAIYNPDYFRELELAIAPGDEDTALKGISGVLRLGTRYEFWAMRRKAVQILQILNPIELDDFMACCDSKTVMPAVEQRKRLFSIIALAQSSGLPQFLPSALYRLFCTLAPDGSEDHLFIQSSEIDDTQKLRCLSGGRRCEQVEIPDDQSTSSKKCTRPIPVKITGRTLFRKIVWPTYSAICLDGCCYKCTLAMEGTYRATQQRMWNLLPDYFGFPGKSWAELKQMDAEAINQ